MIELTLDGDKSLSHRYLLFSSLIASQCKIRNLNKGKDVASTLKVLSKLGMRFESTDDFLITDSSKAYNKDLDIPLNCENSGTTIRLLSGILAAKSLSAKLIGDDSLSKRPMGRIIKPLTLLGAKIKSRQGLTPISIFAPDDKNQEFELELDVASAQVKSAILLFSYLRGIDLNLKGKILSRDHTELLLKKLGANIYISDEQIQLQPSNALQDFSVKVPGDFSSAMFIIAYRLLKPGKTLLLRNILLNPTRCHCLKILQDMGAKIEIENDGIELGEKVGDLKVNYTPILKNPKSIKSNEISLIIDEIPILSLIFSRAQGEVLIKNVQELKFKESDRLEEITKIFSSASIENDSLKIIGPNKSFHKIQSLDHRILMTKIVAQVLEDDLEIDDLDISNIEVSYKDFMNHLFLVMNG